MGDKVSVMWMNRNDSAVTPPIITSAEPEVGLAALERASRFVNTSPTLPASLHDVIVCEESIARGNVGTPPEGTADTAAERLTAGPVLAILLDPALGSLTGEQRDTRLRQILHATRTAPRRINPVLPALAVLALTGGVAAVMILDKSLMISPMFVMMLIGMFAMFWTCRPSSGSPDDDAQVSYPRINLSEARQVASIVPSRANPVDPGGELKSAAMPRVSRKPTAADVRQAVDDLLAEWGKYRLDIEAWYVTKPLLHDTTGTVATTVAYERAMTALIAAVDDLPDDASQDRINAAVQLADAAWDAWHAADEYAAEAGLGDRSPSERSALQRLGRLVERLTRSAATDPELPMVKRSIQDCLDRITTVSVSWGDIATLPAIEAAGLLPQIPAKHQHQPRVTVDVERDDEMAD
ncbi:MULTISPECIES: hypothetical protein [Mycobacterium avium complex (MAC)]|uniref:hypothetical protein n=1 Tax=Mycobacterium avium complex (MAC) TaxID=120793 RepID=UPI000A01AAB1|nr:MULTISPECIES: hypothetical protein [Mycobacterium avium complex (MAC)]UCN12738.1 hypothetical protein LFT50_27840 [Mycobacterium intracellulare subsp. chimaera]